MNKRYSNIVIRRLNKKKQVAITSDFKPEIISSVTDKWQSLLDNVARISDVPAALIMRLKENTIEVFLKSNTNGNPYEAGEEAKLIYGLYCETVIGTQKELLIPDARKDVIWKDNNPDVDINMISYLGLPINWPDGEVFGTICILDNKENHYNENYKNLLQLTKQHLEIDFQALISNQKLINLNRELAESNYLKSRFLSLISHDVRSGVASIDELVKLTLTDYDNLGNDELKSILYSLSESASSTYILLENLLFWSKNDLLHLKPVFKLLNIVEIMEQVLKYFNQLISLKNIKIYKTYSSNDIQITGDENMIRSSFRNIISNAIKYNNYNGKIMLDVSKKPDNIIIVIKDTGIGMNKETLKNLFHYSGEYNKQGTKGESSHGIGLLLIKDFLEKNGAIVNVSSEVVKGTKYEIVF